MRRWIAPAAAAGVAAWASVAWAQDPAGAVSDLAKTPISIFGAWGLSLSILIAWIVSLIRTLGAKDALLAKKDEALAALNSQLFTIVQGNGTQAEARTTVIANAMVAGNLINDKVADTIDEFRKDIIQRLPQLRGP